MRVGPHFGRLFAKRQFTNEIGNEITIWIEDGAPEIGAFHRIITIEGPKSKITSGLTIMETDELHSALAASLTAPALTRNAKGPRHG